MSGGLEFWRRLGPGNLNSSGVCKVGASKEGLALAAGEPPETNSKLQHGVDERCMVEIRRI
jgi:hypothetical protein